MAAKETFTVGDIKVYARGQFWHCSYWTPGGRQRQTLRTANQRAAERKARQIDDLVSRQAWDELEDLFEEKKKPMTFQQQTFQTRCRNQGVESLSQTFAMATFQFS